MQMTNFAKVRGHKLMWKVPKTAKPLDQGNCKFSSLISYTNSTRPGIPNLISITDWLRR